MALYTYRCSNCSSIATVQAPIAEGPTAPSCGDCGYVGLMVRDYRTDAPQPAPMWPEHFNPSSGTVVRTERQLADDLKRKDEALYQRTGIEQRSVVVSAADTKQPD